jgi:serine/threonine protein phosphatase PrpC
MRIEFAGDTHVGMKREHNEDSLLIMPEEDLFVVADGMGGHASGEIASKLAVDTIKAFFRDTGQDEDITWPFRTGLEEDPDGNRLVTAIKLANQRIHEASSSQMQLRGMGTTVVAIYCSADRLYVAHVGDSRCYRFREGKLEGITEDHSLLNDFRRSLQLTPEEERNFPHKNIIVRALGMKSTVDVDLQVLSPQQGDVYVLCSDGLTGEVEDDEMQSVLATDASLANACRTLVQMANENGGKDNITVVLARFDAETELPEFEESDLDIAADGQPALRFEDLSEEIEKEVSDDDLDELLED